MGCVGEICINFDKSKGLNIFYQENKECIYHEK